MAIRWWHGVSAVLLLAAAPAQAVEPVEGVDGLVATSSPYSPGETMDRFEAAAEAAELNVFARIDHAEGAAGIGEELAATELLVFGNPEGGTPFMQCAQTVGIDLPLKALVWQDDEGEVWLGYNDPHYLAERHGAADCPAAQAIAEALPQLVAGALDQ